MDNFSKAKYIVGLSQINFISPCKINSVAKFHCQISVERAQ